LLKVLKSKKGISPILATLLLIVIAVAAIIVTYAWVMAFMGAQTGAGGTILQMENIHWNTTDSTTTITIRNIGTSQATIVRLYAGTTDSNLVEVTIYTDINIDGKTGLNLPAEQAGNIILDWPNALSTSWTSGEVYHFKVVPVAGAELSFQSGRAP
jgi:flagellin-like protein